MTGEKTRTEAENGGVPSRGIWALAAALITFAVFLPALRNGFVGWDDPENILLNQNFRGFGPAQLKWMFTTFHMGPYQPLSWLSYAADHLVWGLNPFGYHLTNVLLHAAGAAVFFLLALRLLSLASGEESPRGLALPAFFAALFFSLHPLRVESVAWATERRDVLCGLFYILAAFWYVSTRRGEGLLRRNALPLAAFLLALLSKGMAVTLPLALLILDIYPLRRLPADPRRWAEPEFRAVWLEKVPYFLLAAVFGAVGYVGQEVGSGITPYSQTGLGARAAQILFALLFYIRKTLLPLELSPMYQLPAGYGLTGTASLLTAGALAAITAAAFYARRRWPAVPAALAAYACMLLPVSGIVKFGDQAAADRYSYLPGLGFALLAGGALLIVRRRLGRKAAAALVLAALLTLAGLTWRQQGFWKDSGTLWSHALELDQNTHQAHNNLAGFLLAKGDFAGAELHYAEALRLNPDYAEAHNNFAGLLARKGDLEGALRHCLEAARCNPLFPAPHLNAGIALYKLGRPDEAAAQFREALRLKPDYEQAARYLTALNARPGGHSGGKQ